MAVSSLAVSFVGREVFERSGSRPLVTVAVTAFLVPMAASVYVLLPRKPLVFALGGSAVYEQFYAVEGGTEEVHRRLAYDLMGSASRMIAWSTG